MFKEQHPITPPAELVQEWWKATPIQVLATDPDPIQLIAAKSAQWGADQELEAVKALAKEKGVGWFAVELQQERRPKPPSLKEQALAALKRQSKRSVPSLVATQDCDIIRRALEQLDD